MRLAAAAGWYWWLGGHKAEGIELLTAAANTPGEVSDEIRAMVYALAVTFITDGPSDQYQAEEWIHKAHRFTQRSQSRNPLLGLVAPLERMLQAPDDLLSAWEPLLDDQDPWLRVLARLHLGKMRIMLGQGERDADVYLEMALAEFRALGERWGISRTWRCVANGTSRPCGCWRQVRACADCRIDRNRMWPASNRPHGAGGGAGGLA